ncbi:MAG: extracellular solute-binding protein [Lachnospiraceae bacterium]|nr:extracellular solute-binding protein [Lachnospiraceae bacterium]
MKGAVKKLVIFIGVIAVGCLALWLMSLRPVENFSEKYEGTDLTADVAGATIEGTYEKYQNAHADAAKPGQDVVVDLFSYIEGEGVEVTTEYEGADKALYTDTDSKLTWEVNIPEAGVYNLYVEYMTVESRGVAIERSLYINNELPFTDAENITFTRIWTDAHEPKTDNQGNQIRPTQVEIFDWQSAYFKDDMGYVVEPYQFYFEAGKNTLTIEGVNEPMVIRELKLTAIEDDVTYEEYHAQGGAAAQGEGLTYRTVLQGEDAVRRSESSLYAKYDKASASTQPYSLKNTILNYTGGDAWRTSGQWIEWEFTVPEDGYYNIMVKARQNYARGSVSCRSIYIDGEIPFADMQEIGFAYHKDWECLMLEDDAGVPYEFYLTAGTHTIRLEATLGGMGSILEDLQDSTYRLNQIYRKILVYTGAEPDTYRDYHIEVVYPEILEAMELEYKRLYKIVDDTVAYTGQKADKIAAAQTVAQQMERFIDRPDKITVEFKTFKDNITALGTAILNMTEIKLDVDYIVVCGTETKPEADESNFIENLAHEVRAFVASFTVDYNSVGDVYDEDDEVVTVWITSGRDQGTILKTMIDDTFTPESGIKVNVEIVAAEAILKAVMAGRGPNVILGMGGDQPVNYALRGAAEDITQFADYKEVLAPYSESSYRQYRLDDSIYGVPETQTFSVMFYRTDVLEELGLSIPNTWQELIEMLPTIQGKSMSVGIPSASGSSSSAVASTAIASNTPDLTLYFSLLFQKGGDLYNDTDTKTRINDEAGVEAFDEYTRYFTDYGIPTVYDFISRFRSGEMPIGISPYSTYNTLMVSAPEIRGLWDFTLIPGTERVDENGNTYIDRSDFITGSATMMISTEDESLKQKSWEFMKWWAGVDTQVRFGREIEALLGSSARYATANKEAFVQLAWSADDIATLSEQWDWTVGIEEIPGGYYTGRHITNAIRKVTNEDTDPRETIIDYVITINDEITKKRKEFGLPTE